MAQDGNMDIATAEIPKQSNVLDDVIAKCTIKRKILNKKQYETAKEAGVSTALVNMFESGYTNISIVKLESICGALGLKLKITVEDLPAEGSDAAKP